MPNQAFTDVPGMVPKRLRAGVSGHLSGPISGCLSVCIGGCLGGHPLMLPSNGFICPTETMDVAPAVTYNVDLADDGKHHPLRRKDLTNQTTESSAGSSAERCAAREKICVMPLMRSASKTGML